jgi:transcription termination factor 2
MTWERKILRKIYGPKSEQGVWRIRSNLEIQNIYKSSDIVTEIKVRRLEWLGHVVRMEDTRLPKMVFNAKPEGRRGDGRPRLRWLDGVEADIKALGVKRWRIKAQDRKEWSAILRLN